MVSRSSKPKPIPFGERLRGLRLEQGLSLQDLATAISVNERTIRRYEAGLSSPGYRLIHRLAKALRVSLAELHGEDAV